MNKSLSQIVASLFAKSRGGEELPTKIGRLRDEIRKATESEDAVAGQFRRLLESFREIIPDEKQRYHAAIKALSTTSKLSRQEIVDAVSRQIEELAVLEKGLMPALPAWRDELKALQAKAKQLRDDIAKLRDKIVKLESEEKEVLNGMASQEKETALVEKAMRDLFAEIRAEIIHIRNKIEEFTVDRPAVQAVPHREAPRSGIPAVVQPAPHQDAAKVAIPVGMKGAVEQKSEIHRPAAQQDTKWQKKCPMCGGQMNLEANERTWLCYSCAYEEPNTVDTQEGHQVNAPDPAASSDASFDHAPPFAVPLASMASEDLEGSPRGPSPSRSEQPTKSKTCPVCRKKMYWYPGEKAWRCPSCRYERRI